MNPIQATIAANLQAVRARVAAACSRANRDPSSVTLIAVTKYVGADVMDALCEAGATDIGENRLQVAEPKFAAMRHRPRRHMIGPLQTNKVKQVLAIFDEIHSLDRMGLADAIQRRAAEGSIRIPCYIEVNVGNEPQKSGFAPAQVFQAIRDISNTCANIDVRGMMCIPPAAEDAEATRPHFRQLARLCRNAVEEGFAPPSFTSLSMGMSSDFEVAIEEGATHVRVGTALYRGLPGFE